MSSSNTVCRLAIQCDKAADGRADNLYSTMSNTRTKIKKQELNAFLIELRSKIITDSDFQHFHWQVKVDKQLSCKIIGMSPDFYPSLLYELIKAIISMKLDSIYQAYFNTCSWCCAQFITACQGKFMGISWQIIFHNTDIMNYSYIINQSPPITWLLVYNAHFS